MWISGEATARIENFVPLVAQWERSTHPAQLRLYRYLDEIKSKFGSLPDPPAPLFLHLHVHSASDDALLKQCDLENYLTPLFGRRCLDPGRFHLVSATKDTSLPSYLALGVARWNARMVLTNDWKQCVFAPTGSSSSKEWKEQLKSGLHAAANTLPLDGPVETRIVLRCAAHRNWSTLWKPIGDAMGPVVGYNNPGKPYHPRDDRIVHLEFHRIVDEELKNRVEVRYAWRMAVKKT